MQFVRSEEDPWIVQNLTTTLGQRIAGPLEWWVDGGSASSPPVPVTQHLVGPAESGDLLHFWMDQQGAWLRENVSAQTGRAVQGAVSAFTTPRSVENVAACSPEGDLLVFWGAILGHNWQVDNVTAATGQKIKGSPKIWVSWTKSDLPVSVAALSDDGRLLHFWWIEASGWHVEDLTAKTGRTLAGPMAQWLSSNASADASEHIAGVDATGNLLHFWRTPTSDWLVDDISTRTGRKVTGPPAFYSDTHNGVDYEHLVANAPNGHTLVFWDETLHHNWSVVDLTQETGATMQGPFAIWMSLYQGTVIYHLAEVKKH